MKLIDATFVFSWGAPFSLNVTNYSSNVFYYVACTNVTMYGCRAIPSNCAYPRVCTYAVDFTEPQSQVSQMNRTKLPLLKDQAIVFSLFAVNGAGNGTAATAMYLFSSAGIHTNGVHARPPTKPNE